MPPTQGYEFVPDPVAGREVRRSRWMVPKLVALMALVVAAVPGGVFCMFNVSAKLGVVLVLGAVFILHNLLKDGIKDGIKRLFLERERLVIGADRLQIQVSRGRACVVIFQIPFSSIKWIEPSASLGFECLGITLLDPHDPGVFAPESDLDANFKGVGYHIIMSDYQIPVPKLESLINRAIDRWEDSRESREDQTSDRWESREDGQEDKEKEA